MHARLTFVERRENTPDICVDVYRRALSRAEIALGHIACAGPRNHRAGEHFSSHMFVVGAAVNVYDIASPILHFPHSLHSDQQALVSAICGASRSIGRERMSVAKWAVVLATALRARRWAGNR